MKITLTFAMLLTAATVVVGQGQFLFNTHDPDAGNDVRFIDNGTPVSGSEYFMMVLVGPDAADLEPVTGTLGGPLPMNRTGAGAGYPNPFSDIYTVPGMGAGQKVTVGYTVYLDDHSGILDTCFGLIVATSPMTLTEPPTPPNEVALGVKVIEYVPEPSTTALGLLGCAFALVVWGRKTKVHKS